MCGCFGHLASIAAGFPFQPGRRQRHPLPGSAPAFPKRENTEGKSGTYIGWKALRRVSAIRVCNRDPFPS
jgi:hypothetical protein